MPVNSARDKTRPFASTVAGLGTQDPNETKFSRMAPKNMQQEEQVRAEFHSVDSDNRNMVMSLRCPR